MDLHENTRTLLANYGREVAELNGVPEGRIDFRHQEYFDVNPTAQQTLYSHMTEPTGFLTRVNRIPVRDLVGQKIGMGPAGLLARNVDTSQPGVLRKGVNPVVLDARGYQLYKTNYDVCLKYALLDTWARFPDFSQRISDFSMINQAQDRLRIGFNGTHWSAQSDPVAHPMGEDVNKGWLQHMREDNEARWLDAVPGGKAAGKVTYGPDGDFSTIDDLVWNARDNLLPSWAKKAPGLCVIVSDDIITKKYGPIMARSEGSLDQLARDQIMAQLYNNLQFGGLPGVRVPYMPDGTFFITVLGDGSAQPSAGAPNPIVGSNLSIYYQEGRNRRALWDTPWDDGITDYNSANEGFVIEDLTYACGAENIEYKAA